MKEIRSCEGCKGYTVGWSHLCVLGRILSIHTISIDIYLGFLASLALLVNQRLQYLQKFDMQVPKIYKGQSSFYMRPYTDESAWVEATIVTWTSSFNISTRKLSRCNLRKFSFKPDSYEEVGLLITEQKRKSRKKKNICRISYQKELQSFYHKVVQAPWKNKLSGMAHWDKADTVMSDKVCKETE